MSTLDLIGRVAARRVLGTTPSTGGRSFMCMIGLDKSIISAIARWIAAKTFAPGEVQVFVDPQLVDGDISPAAISKKGAVYYRNHASPGVRLTVCSVPANKVKVVGKTLDHNEKIDEAWLLQNPGAWAAEGLALSSDDYRRGFANALEGLIQSGAAHDPLTIAEFTIRVANHILVDGLVLEKALRRALPVVQLPRDCGDPRLKISDSAETADRFFSRAMEEARPALFLKGKDGEPLNRNELRDRLRSLANASALEPDVITALDGLIADRTIRDGLWTSAQKTAAELPWERIEPFFTDARRKAKPAFGDETLDFFGRQFRNTLTADEVNLLKDLSKDSAKPSEPIDQFFTKHRSKLQTDSKLYKRWERLVFRAPLESEDLAEGLLRLAHRATPDAEDADENATNVLVIRLRGADQLDFWTRNKNTRILRFLRDRYRGLPELLAPKTILHCGRCWNEDWDRHLSPEDENESQAKSAIEFEFEAFLVPHDKVQETLRNPEGKPHVNRAQLTWRPPAEALGLSLPQDLRSIRPEDPSKATALLTGRIQHNKSGLSSATAAINLRERSSIVDVFGQSDGYLAARKEENSIHLKWCKSLTAIRDAGILTAQQANELRASFDEFQDLYGEAIEAILRGEGIGSPLLIAQANAYGRLLADLMAEASQEICIRELITPITAIGIIVIDGDEPAAIVANWQPLRLGELAAKARQLVDAMNHIVGSTREQRPGVEDFVNDRVAALAGTYYTDVAIAVPASLDPVLLAETDTLAGCSLLELLSGSHRPTLTDEPAEAVVRGFDRVADEYLKLRPHEKANFSVVILNAESENLPLAMARGLARRIESDSEIRSDLVVTDDDPVRLRHVYERQNRRIGHEVDVGLASEAARSFLSRLRVGIFSPDTLAGNYGLKAHDIVLLQDVIARNSKIRWTKGETSTEDLDLATSVPTARSKRRPFKRGNTTSALYLTAPKQPLPCRAYVDALHTIMVREFAKIEEPWLPIQEVEFQSGEVKDLLVKAHALATWVMTFDRVADRRLVATENRRIVRYFSVPGSTHNVIVSTEISEENLGTCLSADLDIILPSIDPAESASIKKEIYFRAASLSGGIVMRGAQWSNYAQELLGLILTQRELDRMLRKDRENKTAWFYLDDYRDYLELTGEMADILGIDFSVSGGSPEIRVVIAESKYVGDGVHEHRHRSMRQLENTFADLNHRLTVNAASLDPSIWRNRLADMILEHMEPFDQVGGIPQQEWLEALRSGRYPLKVSGHSLVFSHSLDAVHEAMPVLPDADKPLQQRRRLAQWVFSRATTAATIKNLRDDTAMPLLYVPTGWPSELGQTADATTPNPIETPVLGSPEPTTATCALPNDSEPISDRAQASIPELEVQAAPTPAESAHPTTSWRDPIGAVLSRLSKAETEADADAWLQEKIIALRNALQTEGMDAPVLGHRLTPNTGLVYVGGQSLTVSWLERKQTDLLTRYGLEIVRITAMPARIAIGLRRPARTILHLADAWLRRNPALEDGPALRFAPLLGEKEDDGSLFYLPLASDIAGQEKAAPHSLISGTTGSGKGILVTNLILDLCALNSPEQLDLHLIDPKRGVDYAWARRLPHLRGGIVDSQDDARAVLSELVEDMERRYEKIAAENCRNIDQYNRKVQASQRLPRVVIFFDEVANWMQDDDFKGAVDAEINKIATKSRAAGFHLFMIYQRADNQVMTMQLRTNLGNKLILRLGDEGSSKIALNEKGAERLLGKGHLIAKLDTDEKIYLQVPFIGDDEVDELAEAIIESWSTPRQQAAE